MPSSSRKRNKGQARKAKAKAKAAAVNVVLEHQLMRVGEGKPSKDYSCNHVAQYTTSRKCSVLIRQFIMEFFEAYINSKIPNNYEAFLSAMDALSTAYSKFPEAVNNEAYRDLAKKCIISNGVEYLLGTEGLDNALPMSLGCAAALMIIDSYAPSTRVEMGIIPTYPGTLDKRDAKAWLRNMDILNGCTRSLVKFFVNQTPCNCLDGVYDNIKSKSKVGRCRNCEQMKERKSMFICTGCERGMYCSKICQLEHVPKHKKFCKIWQRYDHTHG